MRLIARAGIQIALFATPWAIRRPLLRLLLGFRLHRESHIGFALIFAERVSLGRRARIGHFTLVSPIALLDLAESASLGRGNRVIGAQRTVLYTEEHERHAALVMGRHSAITRNHLLDASNTITVGEFTTVAGYATQVMTHSPDFRLSRQTTKPITIGSYCFIGTRSIILQGVTVADFTIVAAGSVVNKTLAETHSLYAGTPAVRVAALDEDLAYFHRRVGRFRGE